MAIAAIFEQPGMTSEQYGEILKKLEEAGLGAPDGRAHHVACQTEGGWFVVDVWDSPEQLEKFGETLMPIIEGVGATPVAPTIRPVHNIIKG